MAPRAHLHNHRAAVTGALHRRPAHLSPSNTVVPRPPAFLDADVRVGERPPHVGHVAVVGAGWADEIWVLPLAAPITGSQHVGAIAIALRGVSVRSRDVGVWC